MPTSSDRAYLAGLIDGEGYLRPKDRGQLRIALTQEAPLRWAAHTFGGRINGPYPLPSGRQKWEWCLTPVGGLRSCLKGVLPFLRIKHEQARLMLELIDEPAPRYRNQYSAARHDRCEILRQAIKEAK